MPYSKVAVGLDGSQQSRRALVAALDLVSPAGVVYAVSVEENLPRYAAVRGEVDETKMAADRFFAELAAEAAELAAKRGQRLDARLLRGHAAHEIVEFARREAVDLIVLGHSGHSGVWGALLGTTAERVVRHAPCNVLVVRSAPEG